MTHCQCCGQKVRRLNPHRMCRHKVRLLEILSRAKGWVTVRHGSNVIVDGEQQHAPYRAEAHASRLAWFGLAEHGAHRSALYRITPNGINFLLGMHSVPATIWCKDGVVISTDPELVTVHDIKDVVFDRGYWDNYWAQV